jgi:hypothetical protein
VTDNQRNAALVDIPLTFGAETPEVAPVAPDFTKDPYKK